MCLIYADLISSLNPSNNAVATILSQACRNDHNHLSSLFQYQVHVIDNNQC